MRPLALLLCLGLGACAGANASLAPSSEPATTGSVHSPLARAAQASGKNEDWWKEGGVTREKINAMCWMKYERGRNDMPVEKRADLVDACVKQALKEHPIQ
jgi:hypothetical protein